MKQNFFLGFLGLAILCGSGRARAEAQFQFVPEAERGLKACVMGLDPANGEYFNLPKFKPGLAKAHGWDRQLYWLNFEISHGRLMLLMPPEARIFVAAPDLGVRGLEATFFKAYLRERAHWSQKRITEQLRFFKVNEPLIWAQDFALQVGLGPQGQRLMYVGDSDNSLYRSFSRSLTQQHPDFFSQADLRNGVSGEGGDLALARFPSGETGLVLGQHRVKHYFQAMGRAWVTGQALSPEVLIEIEQAYSKAYGLPTLICPKRPLLEGTYTDELFHLDMVASFMSRQPSQVVVPILVEGAADHFSGETLKEELVAALQAEFSVVASELKSAGFQVVRAPLNDDPSRSPTNSIKFRAKNGERIVLLARYSKAPGKDSRCKLEEVLRDLNSVASELTEHPIAAQIKRVDQAIAAVWQAMTVCDSDSDPIFKAQAEAYYQCGYQVIPIPDYPWGAGGLHCQFSH